MTSKELKNRTKDFALGCLNLGNSLPNTRSGNHISDQLMRCSSSVAANYRAACLSQSKAAFAAKISIVIEEIDEAAFWLEFAIDAKMIDRSLIDPELQEAKELTSIFISSRKTVQK